MQLTTVNFNFPTFGLSVEHNSNELIFARFYDFHGFNLPLIQGDGNELTNRIIDELQHYVDDAEYKISLPYSLKGTAHQLKVWHVMESIPCGQTLTYGDVARKLQSAPRAVGGACGKNPLPVIVPCHRIIGANQSLGGFNSGNIFFSTGIKKWLLEHEGISIK